LGACEYWPVSELYHDHSPFQPQLPRALKLEGSERYLRLPHSLRSDSPPSGAPCCPPSTLRFYHILRKYIVTQSESSSSPKLVLGLVHFRSRIFLGWTSGQGYAKFYNFHNQRIGRCGRFAIFQFLDLDTKSMQFGSSLCSQLPMHLLTVTFQSYL
jgi:hypothetical protein